MDIEWLRKYCLSLPATSEDIKWANDLCFLVGGKMFCVAGLEQPLNVAFKVPDEIFEELSTSDGIIPAPYMARNKWVMVQNVNKLNRKQWEKYIFQSYTLIKNKLPKKLRKELGIE
ncbi:MAG TPA: MmcQ/YjbR family DNA-binding protein [Flavitalea sp.]|nr:MmcQ/YjbR family DNA-binding protein [Flavitalea sp.]